LSYDFTGIILVSFYMIGFIFATEKGRGPGAFQVEYYKYKEN
jgi:hypothetical protein